MKTSKYDRLAEDYRIIEKAIEYIENNHRRQPALEEIAAHACMSKFHFQRMFKRWAGVSPTTFMRYLTLDHAKRLLSESESLLSASYESGLSGPGRLHDLFVEFEAMTPGEYKRLGKNLEIHYGFHPTPFGDALVAVTRRGICHFGFIGRGGRAESLKQLRKKWPGAVFHENAQGTGAVVNKIFKTGKADNERPFHLMVKGTNFQVNVWRALLTIPQGTVFSYQDMARIIGKPDAIRAVAGAIAANPIAYLIPCHRVIAKSGHMQGYRWGTTRKKSILAWEAGRSGHLIALAQNH